MTDLLKFIIDHDWDCICLFIIFCFGMGYIGRQWRKP